MNFFRTDRKKIIFIVAAISLVLAFVIVNDMFYANETRLDMLEKLSGTWELEDSISITYEDWQRVSEETFEGISLKVLKKTRDTIAMEYLRVMELGSNIYYLAKVKHNNYPILFKLTEMNGNRSVFVNPEHDFPQRIIYSFISENKLHISIDNKESSGINDKVIEFNFRKVK